MMGWIESLGPFNPQGGSEESGETYAFTNGKRAEKVGELIESGGYEIGDPESAVVDLLADVMHFCHREKLDYPEVAARAEMHFDAERTGVEPR